MENEIIRILKKVGAVIIDSHIVLTSGRHTSGYINPDQLLPHTQEVSKIGKIFAEKFRKRDIDVVVGPAIGGIVISQWVAYHLTRMNRKDILGLFTEKTPDKNQVFERGFGNLVKGKKVLVVEDITATGGSAKKAADSVIAAGGNVVTVSVIVNRDPDKVTSEVIGYPFEPLAIFRISSHSEEECPLCKKNVPINIEVGHGKEFLERNKK